MNNEPFTPEELQKAETLNTTIDSLRKQRDNDADQLLSASAANIDPVFEQRLHADLLKRFSRTPQSPWKLWKLFGIPTAAMAVLTVGVVAAMKPELFTQKNTAATTVAQQTNTNTSAGAPAVSNAGADGDAENANTATDINSGSDQQTDTRDNDNDEVTSVDAQLASLEPDLSELSDINHDMQATMDDLDDILDSIDSLDSFGTDTNNAASELEQLPL